MLDLLRPIYEKTAAYGHFGREEPEFTWERTDKAAALRAAAGLARRASTPGRSRPTRSPTVVSAGAAARRAGPPHNARDGRCRPPADWPPAAGRAAASTATLAAGSGVSRGTVSNRLRKLEDEQVITGYTVRLRPDAEPQGIRAWMGVQVDGNQTREVVARLMGEPGLVALHDTNGRWDLLAELRAASTAELSQVLERVRLIKGIRHTETSILLASYR